jgi:hypothetical protein
MKRYGYGVLAWRGGSKTLLDGAFLGFEQYLREWCIVEYPR